MRGSFPKEVNQLYWLVDLICARAIILVNLACAIEVWLYKVAVSQQAVSFRGYPSKWVRRSRKSISDGIISRRMPLTIQ